MKIANIIPYVCSCVPVQCAQQEETVKGVPELIASKFLKC